MSMKRLAVLAAVQTAQYAHNGTITSGGSYNVSTTNGGAGRTGRYETDLHGNVNILLGGVMLSGVVMVVVIVCYCCHRNIRKPQPQEYPQYWRDEPDALSLEVFTMDSHAMCYERFAGVSMEDSMLAPIERPVTSGPPPAYDSLIFNPQNLPSPSENKKESPTSPGNTLPVPIDVKMSEVKEIRSRKDDEGLPSYEAALKLEANGYV